MFELFMAGKTLKKWQILVTRTKAETYPEIIMLQKKMPFSSEIRLDITNFFNGFSEVESVRLWSFNFVRVKISWIS